MSVTKPGTVRAGLVTLASGIMLWSALEAAQRAFGNCTPRTRSVPLVQLYFQLQCRYFSLL